MDAAMQLTNNLSAWPDLFDLMKMTEVVSMKHFIELIIPKKVC